MRATQLRSHAAVTVAPSDVNMVPLTSDISSKILDYLSLLAHSLIHET